MTYYASSLILECDNKKCRVVQKFQNEDKLSYSMLIRIAEERGWYVPSGGIVLCPKCLVETEAKYQAKLKRQQVESNSKKAQSSIPSQPSPVKTKGVDL